MVSEFRKETDTMGEVLVCKDKYWGAQTQRSIEFFNIGVELMPQEIIEAFAYQKYAAAQANCQLKKLNEKNAHLIMQVCEEIIAGKLAGHFPLKIWQTGSGTQTNMNVNEVIANRGNEIVGSALGSKAPLHPNDHVNLGQSSNDTFPTVMHIATVKKIITDLYPALEKLQKALKDKQEAFSNIVKTGRTHLQDATPLTMGQEFSAYHYQISMAHQGLKNIMPRLLKLAQGGTAVGTGLNTHEKFAEIFIEILNKKTGYHFEESCNKFEGLACHDGLVECSGQLNVLAVALTKIANDIRFLATGPRCGIGELILPENEPGSSIMPGKVNPTQCEALTMIAAQVMGNHVSITIGGANSHLQLNVYKPLIIYNLLQSIHLLSQGINNFVDYCLQDIQPNLKVIQYHLEQSLMLVTALTPILGYDKAAMLAKKAYNSNKTLKEICVGEHYLSEEKFDELVDPKKMIMALST